MIKKIVIEIDGKEQEYMLEQARKLYDDLHQIFGQPTYYPQPIYIKERTWTDPIITYGSEISTSHGASDDTMYIRI